MRHDQRCGLRPPLQMALGLGLLVLLTACTEPVEGWCVENNRACEPGYECKKDRCVAVEKSDTGMRDPDGIDGKGGSGGNSASGGAGGGQGGGAAAGQGGADGGTIDAPPEPVRVPGTCETDEHCKGIAGTEVCVVGKCRACDQGRVATCPATAPFCSKDNTCISCMTALTAGQAVCAEGKCAPEGWCAECLDSSNCNDAVKPICAGPADMPKKCAGCKDPGLPADACKTKNPALPACGPDGDCVECAVSTDCTVATAPICVANKCAACTKDQECADRGGGPGLCLIEPDAKGGRCATDAETINVGKAGCGKAGGTVAVPFCTVQEGVDALTKDKRVLVVRGGPFGGVKLEKANVTGTPIWIVGLKAAGLDAVINPAGLDPGISISKVMVDVRIRSLTVRGSEDVGIKIDGSATVRLNRCIVAGNLKGGFSSANGAGFDISNSVFADNAAGGGAIGALGGLYLAPSSDGRLARVRTSTVMNNGSAGVLCTVPGTVSLTGLLLVGNDVLACKPPVESLSGVDPLFNPTVPYHLTDGSPCRNKVSTGNAPLDDLDGDPRDTDKDGKTDCGADEFKQP